MITRNGNLDTVCVTGTRNARFKPFNGITVLPTSGSAENSGKIIPHRQLGSLEKYCHFYALLQAKFSPM